MTSDRNRAAIALDADTPATEAADPAPQPDDQVTPRKAPSQPDARARSASTSPTGPKVPAPGLKAATARLGIYLTPAEFTDAKAAYLADWQRGGQADTFARWIAGALDEHASRTPGQRAERAQPRGRAGERTGSTRSFNIPADTVARMRDAIRADNHAGRWPSDSAWCVEAISLAVDAARAEHGGPLPTPPPRLPNRLVR